MAPKFPRSTKAQRHQNLTENDLNLDDSVRFHDRNDYNDGHVSFSESFDYFVEDGEAYKVSIEKLRKILWCNRSTNKLIVLDLRLKFVDYPIKVFIRPSDLYLLGIGFDGKTYEFGNSDDNPGLLGFESKSLGYGENYNDMGGLENVTIGYQPFLNAVIHISKGKEKVARVDLNVWKDSIRRCLATLTVMLCEGTRFNPLFDKFNKQMHIYNWNNISVQTWMTILINNWKAISDKALNGEVSGNEVRKPPVGYDSYDNDHAEMALIHKDWAIHAIAVNQQLDALPNVPTVDYQNFHLIIVGDKGTGKTTFVKTCFTREFLNNEESTRGVEFHPLDFSTINGMLRINCWDVEVNDNFRARALRDRCYKQCDFAIIMCDVTNESTCDNVLKWNEDLCRVNENIQIVICGNKADVPNEKKVKCHQPNLSRLNKPQYFKTSAKSMLNLEKPFRYLAKKFAGLENE